MKRCFGLDERIIDHDWKHLSQHRSIREPHEPMPMLRELLQYLATPGLEKTWLLLDIKVSSLDVLIFPPDRTLTLITVDRQRP